VDKAAYQGARTHARARVTVGHSPVLWLTSCAPKLLRMKSSDLLLLLRSGRLLSRNPLLLLRDGRLEFGDGALLLYELGLLFRDLAVFF